MATILDRIMEDRRKGIDEEKKSLPVTDVLARVEERLLEGRKPIPFLVNHRDDRPFLIAEIKKASPSKGVIRSDFDVPRIAAQYEASPHVSALSVLTEPLYFSGSCAYLEQARGASTRPLLMKDFIFDPYQVMRGFLSGASAFLLIASLVSDEEVRNFSRQAKSLGMSILFEVHSLEEYRRALDLEVDLVGINNRDLNTFVTDVEHTIHIIESLGLPQGKLLISESGIRSRDHVQALWKGGVQGFLIGEEFMRHQDITGAVEKLMVGR